MTVSLSDVKKQKIRYLSIEILNDTLQTMKFSIKGFFSKCDQICSFLRIRTYLLKKSFMENVIFCELWRFSSNSESW